MKKRSYKKFLAVFLSFAMVVPVGICTVANSQRIFAAEDDNPVFTKILEAEDISLRMKWNDKSNVGEGHTVTFSDGSTITAKDNGSIRKEMTAQQLADTEMGIGINLGNTMEATYAVEKKASLTKTDYDTAWGQPVTTQEYIDCLHSYGINTVRIPVAWSNGDIDDGNYTIRTEMMDRIEEVVNYALNDGMYVIINDHWDNQWWGQFGACKKDADGNKVVDEETRKAAWTRYERYWMQICERFKDYSDHLIFEGANEELGSRLNDSICVNGPAKGYRKPDDAGEDVEAVSGNLTTDELYQTTNEINQKFVDIVRASGGNNINRHLLVAGYNTNISDTSDSRFAMPKDIAENGKNKLFLSVHFYDPWEFCGDGQAGATYTLKDQESTKTTFQKLERFTNDGYAVIVGECGVCEPVSAGASVTQWFLDTFTESSKYHAVPIIWENGNLLERTTPSMKFKDIGVLLNTINGASGDTSMEKLTGSEAPAQTLTGVKEIPAYIDQALWEDAGIHAFITYQTSSWDYRNSYKPLKDLGKDEHSWEYVQAAGNEADAAAKVTDTKITTDGTYTIALEGIDLSGANSYNTLGISTDIKKGLYPGVTVTDATLKVDGATVTETPVSLVAESEDDYYKFMLVNKWGKDDYPLAAVNDNENLAVPSKSIEISFKISGLSKAVEDLAKGEYVNQETGEKVPPQENRQPQDDNGGSLAKGTVFTSGNFKYKVTKSASGSKNGTVTLTGLSKKGKTAKSLSVAASVKGSDKKVYKVNAIGKKVFVNASAAAIILNKNITSIPESAFQNCKKLNVLTLKAKLNKVAKNAFMGCENTITLKGTAISANRKLLNKTSYKKFK